jgi:hypothetical protein
MMGALVGCSWFKAGSKHDDLPKRVVALPNAMNKMIIEKYVCTYRDAAWVHTTKYVL